MNRNLVFGVLLFSFALVMLGFQPSGNTTTYLVSIPLFSIDFYLGLGIAAIVISLTFLILAIRQKWSDWAEKILNNILIYGIWFFIFWFVYILTFFKGLGAVIEIEPRPWIVMLTFYFGFIIMFYIPVIAIKYLPRK